MLNYVGAYLIITLLMTFVVKDLLEKTAVALQCETLVKKKFPLHSPILFSRLVVSYCYNEFTAIAADYRFFNKPLHTEGHDSLLTTFHKVS